MYLLAPYPTPNPTHFPFLFFFPFFFLPFFLSHKSQPYTFCNAPTQFKSKEKKEKRKKEKEKRKKRGGGLDILRSHTCDPTYPTPFNHTSHKYPHSLGRPLICFFPSSLSLSHLLPQYPLHSTTSTIIFWQGSLENSTGKR